MSIYFFIFVKMLSWVAAVELDNTDPETGLSYNDYVGHENLVTTFNKKLEQCCFTSVFPINQQNTKACCGSLLYNINSQHCCGGIVYELDSEGSCCNGKIYSKKNSRCCKSLTGKEIIVKFPQEFVENPDVIPNISCCGLNLYNNETQICCATRRTEVPFVSEIEHSSLQISHITDRQFWREEFRLMYHPNHLHKIYVGLLDKRVPTYEIYDKGEKPQKECTMKSSTSLGTLFSRWRERYDDPSYLKGFCNNVEFNLFTRICCTVKINDKYESKLHIRQSKLTQCCGLEVYDFTKEICCNNRRVHTQNDEITLGCCGDDAYDFTRDVCCHTSNIKISKTSLESPDDSCCGTNKTAFESDQEICCGNDFFLKDDSEICCNGDLLDYEPGQDCCGSKLYDLSKELCCEDVIITKSAPNDRCCGKQLYDSGTHVCCNNQNAIIAKTSSTDNYCCGTTTYDSETQICCGHHSTSNPEIFDVKVYSDISIDHACCGLQLYDVIFQSCCGDVVINNSKQLCCKVDNGDFIIEKSSKNEFCCGKVSYNPTTHRCCNNTVLKANSHHQYCCGSDIYDYREKICCKENLYVISNHSTTACCDQKLMDSSKQICCRGALKDVKDPSTATCCFNALPNNKL